MHPTHLRRRAAWAAATAALLLSIPPARAQVKMPPAPAVLTPFTLDVARTGSGSGHVATPAGGIACGDKCSNPYSPGVTVVLNAADGSGLFAGWSGDCSGTQRSCTLLMNGSKRVGARFERPKLVVARAPEVSGARVVSNPAGIDCGGACAREFDARTRVALRAESAPAGYVASLDGRGGTLDIVLDKPFVEVRLSGTPSTRITVTGNGKVTSQPAGIAVGPGVPSSTHPFPHGSRITLRSETGEVRQWACTPAGSAGCADNTRQCEVAIAPTGVTNCVVRFP